MTIIVYQTPTLEHGILRSDIGGVTVFRIQSEHVGS